MLSLRSKLIGVLMAVIAMAAGICAQGPQPQPPKTLFFDSDGNQVSNNEFVDIRMANFHIKDQTVVKTLDDGTIEFHLQKIPQEGMQAPDFTARYLDGKPARMADLRGKVLVMNFWFVGCPSCSHEMPLLNELKAKFSTSRDVEFISMTADPHALVKKYLAENRFDYKTITDADAALKQFVVGGYPKNVVIGKDGKIVYWRSTVNAWEKFESVIRAELAK